MPMPKKKSPAQLDREIAESLAIAGATTPHSAKALVTLAQMGTTPAQWEITPIKLPVPIMNPISLLDIPCSGK